MGAGAAQSVAINEPGYNGSITIDATKCDGIATASVASVQGPAATFTVTAAQQGGTCAITLTNSLGESQTVPVSVTITQGVIN